jgi:hypothetical protein
MGGVVGYSFTARIALLTTGCFILFTEIILGCLCYQPSSVYAFEKDIALRQVRYLPDSYEIKLKFEDIPFPVVSHAERIKLQQQHTPKKTRRENIILAFAEPNSPNDLRFVNVYVYLKDTNRWEEVSCKETEKVFSFLKDVIEKDRALART